MNVIPYHNPNANPPWLAMAYVGSQARMTFGGQTEAEAIEKAHSFIAKASSEAKAQVDGEINDLVDRVTDKNRHSEIDGGRGHHFAGKVWLIHKTTRQKIRVDSSQVAQYLDNGYERGGPRSK